MEKIGSYTVVAVYVVRNSAEEIELMKTIDKKHPGVRWVDDLSPMEGRPGGVFPNYPSYPIKIYVYDVPNWGLRMCFE
ncbi:MAG: hypothetical protein K6F57_00645 [Candidatus Saccharibacteria bacterium]|nr:hypothetical protein [Candidatus Saccharibacteria bacterium]